jgi:hypothetical protein
LTSRYFQSGGAQPAGVRIGDDLCGCMPTLAGPPWPTGSSLAAVWLPAPRYPWFRVRIRRLMYQDIHTPEPSDYIGDDDGQTDKLILRLLSQLSSGSNVKHKRNGSSASRNLRSTSDLNTAALLKDCGSGGLSIASYSPVPLQFSHHSRLIR